MTSFEVRANGSGIERPWDLVVRTHDLSGTDYRTICSLSDDDAKLLVEDGASWLYGEPDWVKHAEKVRIRGLQREAWKTEQRLKEIREELGPDNVDG